MKRNTVKIELFGLYGGDGKQSLASFAKMVTDALESVPPEYRDTAVFECDRGYYDSPDTYEAYYYRPETDEEVAAREATHARYEAESRARERRTYEALKAKFERTS